MCVRPDGGVVGVGDDDVQCGRPGVLKLEVDLAGLRQEAVEGHREPPGLVERGSGPARGIQILNPGFVYIIPYIENSQ